MAYVWIDTEGNGIAVQETARDVANKIEAARGSLVELLRAPEEGEDAFRTIFLDKDSIYAVEQGNGAGIEAR